MELLLLKYGNLKLLIPKQEAFIYYATFIAGEYDALRVTKNDIVIDLGANIGDFTVKVAKKAKRVIAVEPSKKSLEILKKNIEINGLNNVSVLPYAVSDKEGKAYLSGEGVSSALSDREGEEIQTITLDKILALYTTSEEREQRRIVIKMDIEGAESLVFKDVKFLNYVSQLAIELHGEENIIKIPKILIENGFSIQEYTLKTQIKQTLRNVIKHPLSFLEAEIKSNFLATKGAINTLRGKNPTPAF